MIPNCIFKQNSPKSCILRCSSTTGSCGRPLDEDDIFTKQVLPDSRTRKSGSLVWAICVTSACFQNVDFNLRTFVFHPVQCLWWGKALICQRWAAAACMIVNYIWLKDEDLGLLWSGTKMFIFLGGKRQRNKWWWTLMPNEKKKIQHKCK